MAREIRVTIDDDEVFERMRARKRELDLSWEEVIHRGLRERERGDIGERVERKIRQRVADSLEQSLGLDARSGDDGGRTRAPGGGPTPGGRSEPDVGDVDPMSSHDPAARSPPEPPESPAGGLSAEVASLSNAEDAELRFPFLPAKPGNRVPLRVRLETTADGLEVTVVAVRTGKSVASMNAFDRGARKEIAAALADGEAATLSLADGAETYRVVPALSWQATDDGPTVTEAAIREVRFDG